MNVFGQAVRVALKDVRIAWPWVTAFVLLVAAALAGRLLPVPGNEAPLELVPFIVVAAAMLVAAHFVQQDPAIEADAFWATRPLAPAAIWLGKVLVVGITVFLPAVAGQGVLLGLHNADAATFTRMIATSAALLGLWTALAMAVATGTRSMRYFVLVLLGLIAAALLVALSQFFGSMTGSDSARAGSIPSLGTRDPLWRGVWLVGLLAVVAWRYSRRMAAATRLPTAVAGLILILAVAGLIPRPTAAWTATPSPPAGAVSLPATVSTTDSLDGGVMLHTLRVQLPDALPGERHLLSATHAYVEALDGRRDVIGLVQPRGIHLAMTMAHSDGRVPAVVPLPAGGWAIPTAVEGADGAAFVGVTLNPQQMQQLDEGQGRVIVLGALHRQRLQQLPAVATRPRSAVAAGGIRATVVAWEPASLSGELVISDFGDLRASPMIPSMEFTLATGGGEVPLGVQYAGSRLYWMVLPSIAAHATTVSVRHGSPAVGDDSARAAAAAPADATLRIRIWNSIDRQSVKVTAAW